MKVPNGQQRESANPPEAQFRSTERFPDAVVILDRLGRIRYVSPVSTRLVGYRPDEIVGTHVANWVHSEDLPQLYSLMARRDVEGRSEPLIGRVRHADGHWHWLEAVQVQIGGAQMPDQFVFLAHEITGRQRLEQQYRMAENIAGFGFWRIEFDRGPLELSPGFLRLFGFERGDDLAQRKKYWPLFRIHPADINSVLRTFRHALQSREVFSFTCRVRARAGSIKVVRTRGYSETNVQGSVVAVAGVSQDITPISQAYWELRDSEEKYRLLTDRASDIISQLSTDGVIAFISPAVRRILGKSPKKLLGRNFSVLLERGERDRFREFLELVEAGTREGPICTVRAHREGGQTVWLELSGRLLKDPNGVPTSLVCAARDVTERKRIEAKLQAARLQAEEASASKSHFLANVSHDLRTPLNAILGFAELIREQIFGPIEDRRYVEYAALIHESGTMLRSFLSDLLDLSKIEAGGVELHLEPIKLGDLIPSCVHQIMPMTSAKNIAVTDHVSGSGMELLADRHALTQILINLLSNAAKFTPEGGQIEISAQEKDKTLELAVRDTGVGIPEADIERVTAPFEYARAKPGVGAHGAGLGLAIVKSLIELHGGMLTIQSQPEKGTRVTVSFPQQRSKKAA